MSPKPGVQSEGVRVMSERWSSFRPTARRRNGYLAVPASGSGPGVVVLQEWWGLVDHIKQVADHFAPEGFGARARQVSRREREES